MFADHSQGEENTINPRSVLLMKIQRNEAAWMDLRFELKLEYRNLLEMGEKWVTEVLST